MEKIGTNKIYAMAAVVFVAVVIGILLSKTDRTINAQNACGDGHSYEAIISNPVPESCTIFTASHGDTVLFGNNEDWINPNTYYWVVPSRGGDYGVVYFGFDNFWRCQRSAKSSFEPTSRTTKGGKTLLRVFKKVFYRGRSH
jgi:hypothetical protein